ncbi:MAG: hypothetical protein AAB303_00010, partial [Chloroflexota bacterium]
KMLDHHYDGLEGDWAEYAQVAQKFIRARWASIPPDDAEDLVQRIILAMHLTAQKLGWHPGGWLWTTARFELGHYWRERAHRRALSLDRENDGNGHALWETLPAPEVDLDAQLDAGRWLHGCSQKVMGIARKLVEGEPLTEAERGYLHFWRKRQGIPTPRSSISLRQAICVVLEQSPTPLHWKEIAWLVAEAYPPLSKSIKKFNLRVQNTLIKWQRNGVWERVAPGTWRLNGTSTGVVTTGETGDSSYAEAVCASR